MFFKSSMSTGSLGPRMVLPNPYPNPNVAYPVQQQGSQMMPGPYHGYGPMNFSSQQFNSAPSTHSG